MVPIKFYRCSICGKIIIVVSDGAGILNCCGTNMAELEPNTGDGAAEKHVPLIKKSNNGINVQISSIIHPMSPEHHIEWIAMHANDRLTLQWLKPKEEPIALFKDAKIGTAYEYCNLHGLWKK